MICAWHFEHQVQELMKFLKHEYFPLEKTVDSFYREEFQHRGSPHIHMLSLIENSSRLGKKDIDDDLKYKDKQVSGNLTSNDDESELASLVRETQIHCHKTTCQNRVDAKVHSVQRGMTLTQGK